MNLLKGSWLVLSPGKRDGVNDPPTEKAKWNALERGLHCTGSGSGSEPGLGCRMAAESLVFPPPVSSLCSF